MGVEDCGLVLLLTQGGVHFQRHLLRLLQVAVDEPICSVMRITVVLLRYVVSRPIYVVSSYEGWSEFSWNCFRRFSWGTVHGGGGLPPLHCYVKMHQDLVFIFKIADVASQRRWLVGRCESGYAVSIWFVCGWSLKPTRV